SFFERRFEDCYALDPVRIAAALKPKTRLVVLSSPHNPSGVLAEEAALRDLARVAEKADIRVLVDEVYLDAALGSKHPPAAALSPPSVTNPGAPVRRGWGCPPPRPDPPARSRRPRAIGDVWAPTPPDRLSVLAFRNLDQLAVRARALIEANSRLIGDFFAGRRELECVPSRSTIAFPRFRDGRDSGPFADRLFRDHRVAVAPGRFFDSPAHFRLSFGGATEKLNRGLAAVGRLLDESTPG